MDVVDYRWTAVSEDELRPAGLRTLTPERGCQRLVLRKLRLAAVLACSTDLNLAASSSSSPLIDAVLCLLPGPAVVLVLGPQGILEHSVEVWYVGRRYACFHPYFPRSRTGMSGNYIQAVQVRREGLIDFIRRQIPARRSAPEACDLLYIPQIAGKMRPLN